MLIYYLRRMQKGVRYQEAKGEPSSCNTGEKLHVKVHLYSEGLYSQEYFLFRPQTLSPPPAPSPVHAHRHTSRWPNKRAETVTGVEACYLKKARQRGRGSAKKMRR